jgi:hypothetical protein
MFPEEEAAKEEERKNTRRKESCETRRTEKIDSRDDRHDGSRDNKTTIRESPLLLLNPHVNNIDNNVGMMKMTLKGKLQEYAVVSLYVSLSERCGFNISV